MTFNWIAEFPESKLTHLARIGCDQCPPLLQIQSQKNRPYSYLRFYTNSGCLSCNGNEDIVSRAWRGASHESHGIRIFRWLSSSRQASRKWNKEYIGNLYDKAKRFDSKLRSPGFKSRILMQRGAVNIHIQEALSLGKSIGCHEVLKFQELYWKQESRIWWLKDGEIKIQPSFIKLLLSVEEGIPLIVLKKLGRGDYWRWTRNQSYPSLIIPFSGLVDYTWTDVWHWAAFHPNKINRSSNQSSH